MDDIPGSSTPDERDQILHQAEGTSPTTPESPQGNTEHAYHAKRKEGELLQRCVVLKDADGTGEGRRGARVAVEERARDAGLQDLDEAEVGYHQDYELDGPPQPAHRTPVSRPLCMTDRAPLPGC